MLYFRSHHPQLVCIFLSLSFSLSFFSESVCTSCELPELFCIFHLSSRFSPLLFELYSSLLFFSLHPSLVSCSLAMLLLGGVVFLPDVCCCPLWVHQSLLVAQ